MSVYRVGRRRRKRKRSSTVVLVPQLQHARLQVLDVNCLALAQVPESLEFSSLVLAQIPDRREAVIFEKVKLKQENVPKENSEKMIPDLLAKLAQIFSNFLGYNGKNSNF